MKEHSFMHLDIVYSYFLFVLSFLLLYLFNKKNIQVIRVGLQNTDEITDPNCKDSEVVAGPYHPAFGQLVEDSIWYDYIVEKIKKINTKVKII